MAPCQPATQMPGPFSSVVSLIRELRRRHVFRVAVAYAAVAWLILSVSDTLFGALRVPEWGVSLVAVLTLLGFPLAVALAWAFDLTPAGVKRTDAAAPPSARVVRQPAEEPAVLAGGPLTAALRSAAKGRVGEIGPVFEVHGGPRVASSAAVPEGVGPGAAALTPAFSAASVAALPFLDLGPGGDHQYLGDGITEELINGLARVRGLRVVSRTSAFAFRGGHVDVREIGARLGVGAVVEGSVRMADERLRLSVRLVNAADGCALWSGTFDRRVEDVFAVQEEIAAALLDRLQEQLAAVGAEPLAGAPGPLFSSTTDNVDAYTLYLRGRARWNERTGPALREAIDFFERALRSDPDFAGAHAGLADSYAILLDYGILAPREGLPPAAKAAARALELGPDLADAHAAAALVRQLEGRWDDAADSFRAALRLNPGYAPARHRYALLLAWRGRLEQARAELERARRLDPLSPVIGASRAWIAYYAGEGAEAVRHAGDVLREHPRFATARTVLALSRLQGGDVAEAVAELEQAVTDGGETPASLALLACGLARAGRATEAEGILDLLRRRARRAYVSPYYLALAELSLGRIAAALVELDAAAAEGSPQLVYVEAEPLLDPLRAQPSFQKLLRRLGLRLQEAQRPA